MKETTINKFYNLLKDIKESNKTISEYCKLNNVNNPSKTISVIKNDLKYNPNLELHHKCLELYDELLKRSKREKTEVLDTDDVSETSYIRNDSGQIKLYSFKIFKKNKPALSGNLTREEMTSIYRLYSYYGASLTQRQISRYFPDYSLIDFKRILRAFNITKASSPFPPHMIEEKTEDELREIQLREKENDFLRKSEEDIIKNNEKLLRKYAQENIVLKQKIEERIDLLKCLESENITFSKEIINNSSSDNTDGIIVLSDLHIGAFNEKFGYIPLEDYTENEIKRRLNKIILSIRNTYDSITVLNLGDSVDSYNKQTTRGGHELPSVLSNKEQSIMYQRIMLDFFSKLTEFSKKINYICVGESNHDGDWGWINNIALSGKLKSCFNIDSYVSNNPIDIFNIQDCSIVYLHGKDNSNQFKNFPLVVNDKTETWFNNYFLDCGKNIHTHKYVIKGDLHQYAYTCAKHFDYISAPSIYGSSSWITANFGKTPWGALLLEVNNNNITTKLIKE